MTEDVLVNEEMWDPLVLQVLLYLDLKVMLVNQGQLVSLGPLALQVFQVCGEMLDHQVKRDR